MSAPTATARRSKRQKPHGQKAKPQKPGIKVPPVDTTNEYTRVVDAGINSTNPPSHAPARGTPHKPRRVSPFAVDTVEAQTTDLQHKLTMGAVEASNLVHYIRHLKKQNRELMFENKLLKAISPFQQKQPGSLDFELDMVKAFPVLCHVMGEMYEQATETPVILESWKKLLHTTRVNIENADPTIHVPMPIEGIPLVLPVNTPFRMLHDFAFIRTPTLRDYMRHLSEKLGGAMVRAKYVRRLSKTLITYEDPKHEIKHADGLCKRYFYGNESPIKFDTLHGMKREWIRRDRLALMMATDTESAVVQAFDHGEEERAMTTLGMMVEDGELLDSQYRAYISCGSFTHQGRSGIEYVFRKAKPVLAFRPLGPFSPPNDKQLLGNFLSARDLIHASQRFLAALCHHADGFYHQTFAGVRAPTWDVIARYRLLKSNEWKFWSVSSQIPLDDPCSGGV